MARLLGFNPREELYFHGTCIIIYLYHSKIMTFLFVVVIISVVVVVISVVVFNCDFVYDVYTIHQLIRLLERTDDVVD